MCKKMQSGDYTLYVRKRFCLSPYRGSEALDERHCRRHIPFFQQLLDFDCYGGLSAHCKVVPMLLQVAQRRHPSEFSRPSNLPCPVGGLQVGFVINIRICKFQTIRLCAVIPWSLIMVSRNVSIISLQPCRDWHLSDQDRARAQVVRATVVVHNRTVFGLHLH